MSKKILILCASPRRGGNSETLADEFARGATEAGNSVRKIALGEKKINYCKACYACAENGECVQKDDMAEIIDKMISADVIVFATPVYFYSMSGQMKVLIDRTVGSYMQMKNKEVYFILTCWDGKKENLQGTVEALRGFTRDCLEGTKERGILYGTGLANADEAAKNKAKMNEAFEMGRTV